MGRRELPLVVGGAGVGIVRRVAVCAQSGAGATSLARRLLLAYHPLAAAACPVGGPMQVIDGSGAPRVVVALNKMDLSGYARETFERARDALARFASASGATAPQLVPVSARDDELVTSAGGRASWYVGPTLVEALLQSQGS